MVHFRPPAPDHGGKPGFVPGFHVFGYVFAGRDERFRVRPVKDGLPRRLRLLAMTKPSLVIARSVSSAAIHIHGCEA